MYVHIQVCTYFCLWYQTLTKMCACECGHTKKQYMYFLCPCVHLCCGLRWRFMDAVAYICVRIPVHVLVPLCLHELACM